MGVDFRERERRRRRAATASGGGTRQDGERGMRPETYTVQQKRETFPPIGFVRGHALCHSKVFQALAAAAG
jgi:hypothetical protein